MSDPFLVVIPRLPTERLLLREPRRSDFEIEAADAADPLSRGHLGGPITPRDAWRRFHAGAGGWVVEGMGWWTVELRGGGPVGMVGVFQRETGPEVEMGWIIHRSQRGRGFAAEAAAAALAQAVGPWGVRRVIARIGKENAVSAAVARRIGMVCVGEADFYGEVDWLYAYDAESVPGGA